MPDYRQRTEVKFNAEEAAALNLRAEIAAKTVFFDEAISYLRSQGIDVTMESELPIEEIGIGSNPDDGSRYVILVEKWPDDEPFVDPATP